MIRGDRRVAVATTRISSVRLEGGVGEGEGEKVIRLSVLARKMWVVTLRTRS